MASVSDQNSEDIMFLCGNPTVERTEGIIHVYKKKMSKFPSDECQASKMLCVLGIPSNINVKDILNFFASMRDGIQEIKVIQGGSVSRYMALVKFKSQKIADQFYYAFNGIPYNSFETDVCQLIYVSHVEAISSSLGASFPLRGFVELPSCPVCLENLDEPLHGILTTILCNHSFHDECISQTADITCPVCRYVQSPDLVADSQCANCDLREHLWICLICGHVGCGRYGRKHAYEHFKDSGHTFALELGKNIVWDYADDAYVHRLALNQADGKLVQLGESSETGDKKMDYMLTEFSAILVSQLESQRQYFECQLDSITTQSTARTSEIEKSLENTIHSLSNLQTKYNTLSKEHSSTIQKLSQTSSLVQKLQSELSEERALTTNLLNSQRLWEERAKKAELMVQDAQEEIRDLMLNFELQSKLEQAVEQNQISSEEITTGTVTVSSAPSRGRRRRKNQR